MDEITGRNWRVLVGDVRDGLRTLADNSVHCCVTSPPYWGLRDYGIDGQIGLEASPESFVETMVEVFEEVRRALTPDGTCWLNIGDCYNAYNGNAGPGSKLSQTQSDNRPKLESGHGLRTKGLKPKDLIGIPWRLAFSLQAAGWYLRSEIIWAKPNGMPGSQLDRCTSAHETVFLLSKNETYFSDFDAIKTPPRESSLIRASQDIQHQAGSHRANGGAKTNGTMKAVGVIKDKQRGHSRTHAGFNARWDAMEKEEQQSQPAMMRDVWFISPATFEEGHFAVMPPELACRCIVAGSREGETILDPFSGSGTTGMVATEMGRKYIGCELNPEYAEMSRKRINCWKYRDAPKAIQSLPGQKSLFATDVA